jgi:hypothetical protein
MSTSLPGPDRTVQGAALPLEDLARARMYECQGTLIGGAVVAGTLGMTPEEYGFQMMLRQRIRWERLAGDLEKIARIYAEHYQVTYGFGEAVHVRLEGDVLRFEMPSLAGAAAGQLAHWGVDGAFLHAIQRGFWRAMEARAEVHVALTFGGERDTVTVTR